MRDKPHEISTKLTKFLDVQGNRKEIPLALNKTILLMKASGEYEKLTQEQKKFCEKEVDLFDNDNSANKENDKKAVALSRKIHHLEQRGQRNLVMAPSQIIISEEELLGISKKHIRLFPKADEGFRKLTLNKRFVKKYFKHLKNEQTRKKIYYAKR